MAKRFLRRIVRASAGLAVAGALGLALAWCFFQYRFATRFRPPAEVLANLVVPPGFQAELFAAEPMVVNPVTFCIDEQNRFYVAETQAFQMASTFDYPDEELASRTFEESEAIRLRDLGVRPHLTGRSERVRVLEDRSGRGQADSVEIFADGFPLSDGIVAGVLARNGSVWLANAPNLWRYETVDGRVSRSEVLHRGYGVRRVNLGHDLHGLVFGPDGKLYFTMGDRGFNVLTREGKRLAVTDSGAVLRCNPDGTDLEVFATGLRNPQKIAFDRFGNLFTCDNDANLGDATRWLYVVEGGDAGWRIGYQMLPGAGPWNEEKIWQPNEAPPYCMPSAGRVGQCPAGLAFYPGTGLPASFDDHFFLCDFNSFVLSLAVKPKGAGFELAEVQQFVGPMWATDLAFSPDGALYISDWVFGFDLSQRGRIYRVSHPAARAEPVVAETRALIAEGMGRRPPTELSRLLGHRDQRVRQAAQFELASRGEKGIEALASVLDSVAEVNARVHAVQGLGQVAATRPEALTPLLPLLRDADPEVRAQAARVLGDRRCAAAFSGLLAGLRDPSLRVRYFAAMGLGKLARREAVEPILQMLREQNDGDPYLRHAGAVALAAIGDAAALAAASRDPSPAVRMGAVLALRRLEDPNLGQFLDDADPAVVLEAARAIYDVPVEGALAALAARAVPPRFPARAAARVVYANFRLGAAEPLARLAASAEAPEEARVLALKALATWEQCTGKDPILGLWRPLPARDRQAAAVAVRLVLPDLLRPGGNEAVTAAAARTAAALDIREVTGELLAIARDVRAAPELRADALRALAIQGGEPFETAVLPAVESPDEKLRTAAVALLGRLRRPDVPGRLGRLVHDPSLAVRQAALGALGDCPGTATDDVLVSVLDEARTGTLPAALRLDVLEAAGKRSAPAVAERRKFLDADRPTNEPLAPWWETLEGGSPDAGRRIFFENNAVSCLRCHKVGGVGGEVGPPLDAVGAKHPVRYLLESIVFPNAVVAPGYGQTTLELKNGQVLVGRVEKEGDDRLILLLPDGQRRPVVRADVETRKESGSAMPEGLAKSLTKRQLRDLIAFLTSLREPVPPAPGDASRK